MKFWVLLAGDALTVAASIWYVVATLLDSARPEVVSWGAWAVLLAEGTIASFSTGQVPAGLYTGICCAACGIVTVLSLHRGTWQVSWLDVLSLWAAAIGFGALLVVHSPGLTVIIAVSADLAAYLPTIRHAWAEPAEEPWPVYLLFGAGAVLTLLAGDSYRLTALAYPLYLALADSFVVMVIVLRRREEAQSISRLLRPLPQSGPVE